MQCLQRELIFKHRLGFIEDTFFSSFNTLFLLFSQKSHKRGVIHFADQESEAQRVKELAPSL
jgi:hypothetical protein